MKKWMTRILIALGVLIAGLIVFARFLSSAKTWRFWTVFTKTAPTGAGE